MSLNKCHFAWETLVRADYTCPAHTHPFVELVYISESKGKLYQDGQVYDYEDESVIVYQPGGAHWVDNEKAGRHICLGVETEWSHLIRPGVYRTTSPLRQHFEEIREYHTWVGPWQKSRLDMLAGLICCDVLDMHESASNVAKIGKPEQIRNFIDEHLHESLSLDELAAMACLHKDYLRQIFRGAFGESLRAYIIRKRMERAAALLKSTDNKISAIGMAVGIENEFYFSRLFKKVYGCPPSAFRRNK